MTPFYSRLPILTDLGAVTLTAWLEERYARRELVYGLHFIDGADGGLFLAAKAFKERAAKLAVV